MNVWRPAAICGYALKCFTFKLSRQDTFLFLRDLMVAIISSIYGRVSQSGLYRHPGVYASNHGVCNDSISY